MDYILNHEAYIKRYMALHDEEARQRKQNKNKGIVSWLKKLKM